MAKKIVTLSESELTGLIKRAISEADNSTENYMTFSNLQQMKRQIDHISTAKENIDQVFDFMMNETRKEDEYIDYEDIQEGRKKTGTKLCARGKSAAKSKFKVYPSAYANGYAVQVCKGKIKGLDGKKQCSGTYC